VSDWVISFWFIQAHPLSCPNEMRAVLAKPLAIGHERAALVPRDGEARWIG